jgi:hypothetical protein
MSVSPLQIPESTHIHAGRPRNETEGWDDDLITLTYARSKKHRSERYRAVGESDRVLDAVTNNERGFELGGDGPSGEDPGGKHLADSVELPLTSLRCSQTELHRAIDGAR